jgi:hypothetical protein
MATGGLVTVLLALAAMAGAVQSVPAPRPTPRASGVGVTRSTALEVCMPAGERAYLGRLRCPGGARATYERKGNVGRRTKARNAREEKEAAAQIRENRAPKPGGRDYHLLDLYEVTCGDETYDIYMDMYHCDGAATEKVPAGFTLDVRSRP